MMAGRDDELAAVTTSSNMPSNPSKAYLLEQTLKRLARGLYTSFSGVLHDVESHALINETKVTIHCHCLKLDGNGRPRIKDLVKVVAEHVIDYAIPRKQIREAHEEYERTHSTQKLTRLVKDASRLFTDLDKSGEGGELLLFALAEKILQLPQLICKMNLKTNTRMHIHGSDGLHAGVDSITGKLILYWGESKIYSNVTDAIRTCLASIAPMLGDYSAGQRDLQLLQRHLDLDNPELEEALKNFLNPDAEEFNSLEYRGLCLVGFDCDKYPKGPSTTEIAELTVQIAIQLPSWKGYVKNRISAEKLDAFAMHFLFVPFPSANEFRLLLRDELGIETQHETTVTKPTKTHQARAPKAPSPKQRARTPKEALSADS